MPRTFIVLRAASERSAREARRRMRPQASNREAIGSSADEPVEVEVGRFALEADELHELSREPETLGAAETMPVHLIAPVPNSADDPAEPEMPPADWGLAAIAADRSEFDGTGVDVAVLDTGIDAAHPAFAGVDLEQRNFTDEDDGDLDGHGTHCAGTFFGRDVDGQRIGVARGVRHALIGKVLTRKGGTTDSVFQGVKWAHDGGARVISLSLGFDYPGKVRQLVDEEGWTIERATSVALIAYRDNLRLLDELMALYAAQEALDGGAVFVAAAGNDSKRDAQPGYTIGKSLPSDAAGVIPVGAVKPDPAGGFRVAPFSNAGVEVLGPGYAIMSAKAGGGLIRMNGTSMAGPHVAGVAALWWQSVRINDLPTRASIVRAKIVAGARADVLAPFTPVGDKGAGLVTAP